MHLCIIDVLYFISKTCSQVLMSAYLGWVLNPVNTVYETQLLNKVYSHLFSGFLTNAKTVIYIRTTMSKMKVFINKIILIYPWKTNVYLVNWGD